ncbi:thiol-disulfide isomerase/thioredoxin [Tumebacillus sp. BK434]|uniref:TlpA family protein disulfide reductase n=1 Tax=Tumebacillus sp. BK434 TaxID=2512169 RepID=UPI0010519528|nr:TlpA disulfide reductase family protein [Tumebacillus sp. BK434]TCP55522.1 thiol-disulfide isomerase/thioredoxin [Tumebacillus sp. BK434]
MNRTSKLLLGVAVIGVLAGAAYLSNMGGTPVDEANQGGKAGQQDIAEMAAVGHRAPSFELQTFDGKTVKLADLQGKPVVLNFWASWCGPCRNEMPDLEEMHKKYGDQVHFYGVNLTSQDNLENAKKFMGEMGVTFPSLMDSDEKTAQNYRTFSIPMTYAVDQNGIISEIHKGQINKVVMDGMLQRLVAGAKQ